MAASLRGKAALVTGGASGIGLAVALRLAADGARVAVADVQEQAGRAAAERTGGVFLRADLRRRDECRGLVRDATQALGGVDILVNDAGFQHVAPIQDFPEDTWDDMIAVMLTAPFLLTRYVWPHMTARRWGRIVNIGSIHSLVASPNKVGYTAAKHGLLGLTRAAALEGGAWGITVNAICPAYVRTPLVERQIAAQARTRGIPEDEVIQKVMLEPAAVKRLIEPDEVAGLTAFLCTDAAAAVTGSAWTMDLGWTAR
jgi:3-hydroxybutyrate dehydrogenase